MASYPRKILIIRFSSFGDVLQTLSVVASLKNQWPEAEIHWVTRSEFVPLMENHPSLTKAWGLHKNDGLGGLFKLAHDLQNESFDRIYDAHNNLRSHFLCFFLAGMSLLQFLMLKSPLRFPVILRRSIKRWKRFLLFRLRINQFEQPFSGQRDLLEPLSQWGISNSLPPPPQLFIAPQVEQNLNRHLSLISKSFIALAPSAAFPLKRWPIPHWKSLLQIWLLADNKINFVLLGGPEDHFLNELTQIDPHRVFNLAGKLSLSESAGVIKRSKLLIANDTGLLHAGEQLGHPTIALMGPAPFGFPSRTATTRILELHLHCRPCSKHGQGPCRNTHYQWCLVGITPEMVFAEGQKQLHRFNETHLSLHE